MKFGELVRRARTAADKTMGDMARRLGVTVVFVSDVERGYQIMSSAQTCTVAGWLSIDLAALVKARNDFKPEERTYGVGLCDRHCACGHFYGWMGSTAPDAKVPPCPKCGKEL